MRIDIQNAAGKNIFTKTLLGDHDALAEAIAAMVECAEDEYETAREKFQEDDSNDRKEEQPPNEGML